MTRGIIDGRLTEPPVDVHPEDVALLGMELRPEDVPAMHRGDERVPVRRGRRDIGRVAADDVIGVGEVEPCAGPLRRQQRVLTRHVNLFPAHVGHRQLPRRGNRTRTSRRASRSRPVWPSSLDSP